MPIEHNPGGSTTLTGDSISFFRLAALKGAVGLELKGIKMRRGPVIWKQAAREFGIKGNKQKVYDWLCAEVEKQRQQQEHIVHLRSRRRREVGGQEVN